MHLTLGKVHKERGAVSRVNLFVRLLDHSSINEKDYCQHGLMVFMYLGADIFKFVHCETITVC